MTISTPVLDGDRPPTFGRSWERGKGRSWKIYDSIVDTCLELKGELETDVSELRDTELEGMTQTNVSCADSFREHIDRNWISEESWLDNLTTVNKINDRTEPM
jgi:hypothetical protein